MVGRLSVLLSFFLLIAAEGRPQTRPKAAKLEISPDEQAILDLTNKEREKEKLPALKANARLFRAAREHSQNMANQDWMLHELDGKGPGQRMQAVGYRFATGGENIASGLRDFEKLLKMWMDSEQHRANILSERFTEIGIGIAYSERDKPYYTQLFAAPRR